MDRDDRLNDFWSADDDVTERLSSEPATAPQGGAPPEASTVPPKVAARARRLVARLLEEDRRSLLDHVSLAERASRPAPPKR